MINNCVNFDFHPKFTLVVLLEVFTFALVFFYGGVALIFFYGFLKVLLIRPDSSISLDSHLSFSMLCILSIVISHYWYFYFGLPYYFGLYTDDWDYNVLWSGDYHLFYGYSPFGLVEYLNGIRPNLGDLHNSLGYVYLIVLLKFFATALGEYNDLFPRFLNSFFLVKTGIYVFKIYTLIKFKRPNVTLFYSVVFFPTMFLNSINIFRDVIVVFFVVYLLYLSFRIAAGDKFFFNCAMFFLGVFCLYFLRASIIPAVMVAVVITFTRSSPILLLLFVVLLVFLFRFIAYYFPYLSMLVSVYTELNENRFGLIGNKIFSVPLPLGFFSRFSFFVLTPFPGLTSFYAFFSGLASLVQVLFLPALMLSLINSKTPNHFKNIFLIMFLMVSLTTANFRHVMMYLPFAILLVYEFFTHNKFSVAYLRNVLLFFSFTVFILLLSVYL